MRKPLLQRGEIRILLLFALFAAGTAATTNFRARPLSEVKLNFSKSIYEQLGLAELGLSETAFTKAMAGFSNLCRKQLLVRDSLISIADMSQTSKNKRFYVIDLQKMSVLYNTYVAHGRNSGNEYAVTFGNRPQSYRSSLGFFVTGDPYQGEHGLSLRLNGCEKGINDRASERGIVIHGADYVSERFISRHGRLGRSQGCPALPMEKCEEIVNCIKQGSCLFVYYPDSNYFRKSPMYAGTAL